MTELNLNELLLPYGIKKFSFKKLDGYISTNYQIKLENGKKFIFKFYADADELNFISEENRLLFHVKDQLDFDLSFPLANQKGEFITQYSDGSFSRLLIFVEGDFLAEVEHSDEVRYQFGKRTAQLNKALANFKSDTIAVRRLHWDLQHAMLNMPKTKFIENPAHKKWIDYYFQQFRDEVLPILPELRSQIIHNDLNDWNVFVKNEDISGFIDLGDVAHSPIIHEVCIALTYLMFAKDNPLKAAVQFLKAYHKILPLEEKEIALLPSLIPTRLAVSLCHSAETKSKSKDTSYILISEKPALELLKKWIKLNPVHIKNTFLKACGYGVSDQLGHEKDLLERRKKNLGKSLSMSYSSPIYFQKAAFQFMYDAHGNSYLDAYNNIPLVGHSHPKVAEAIAKQQRKLNTNTRYLYDSIVNYSDHLLSYFPDKLNKVFFVNSGSAASDLAIRLAQTATNRVQSLVLEHGYHGHTRSAIENSAYKFDGPGGKGSNQFVCTLPLPNLFNSVFDNTEAYVNQAKAQIEELINKGKKPAYFIAEPISGCGGQVPLAPGYLQAMKPFLENHGILMIADEVQTGFGRLGSHFWGFQFHNIVPDIVVLGKPMANGHPIGAVVTTTEIADAFANGMEFFSSFGGNPVSMEAAKAVLEVVEEEQLQTHALEVGIYYKERLLHLKAKFPVIGDVRGEGLFLGTEFINPNNLSPNTAMAKVVKERLKENFVLTSTDGPFDSVIKTKPPLCFDKNNVDEVCGKMEEIFKNVKV